MWDSSNVCFSNHEALMSKNINTGRYVRVRIIVKRVFSCDTKKVLNIIIAKIMNCENNEWFFVKSWIPFEMDGLSVPDAICGVSYNDNPQMAMQQIVNSAIWGIDGETRFFMEICI